MWEDKGPSFTKMTNEQYIEAGNTELSNRAFYEEVQSDPSSDVKKKSDSLVKKMVSDGEISEKVGEYLQCGGGQTIPFLPLKLT